MDGEFDLAKFDEYREDNRLEVKKARNGLPDDLWETYSAFANSNGGCIILGVREALANCLSNADFLLSGSVVIRKYPDKIVYQIPVRFVWGKNRCFGAENHSRVTN